MNKYYCQTTSVRYLQTGFLLPLLLILIVSAGCAPTSGPAACDADVFNPGIHDVSSLANDVHWGVWGQNLNNDHHAVVNPADEFKITPENVNTLNVKWAFTTSGDVSANPTIAGNDVYFPDWGTSDYLSILSPGNPGGSLYSVDRWTGGSNWSKQIREYNDNDFGNISKSSPAIAGDLIIIGDVQSLYTLSVFQHLLQQAQRLLFGWDEPCSGYVYAIHRDTGQLVWKTRVGQYDFDQISQSPVVHNGKIYVGVSTQESGYVRVPTQECCQFQGNVVQIDLHTGVIDWRSYMTYNNNGDYDSFAGAAVWSGAPTIDVASNSIYVGTGQNYHVPAGYKDCILAAAGDESVQSDCNDVVGFDKNYFDSIVAIDLSTGAFKWGMRSRSYDAWNGACQHKETGTHYVTLAGDPLNCPDPEGYDNDFAQPPMLHTVMNNGQPEKRLAAGTKGGEMFSISALDGSIHWRRQVGPKGTLGGMQYGAATDGERIYIQNTNYQHVPYVLEAGPDAGKEIVSGFWAALDAKDGTILWQTQVPGGDLPLTGTINSLSNGNGRGLGFFKWPSGGLTVVNGVVFAGVTDYEGTMVAMDAATGAILWQFETGGQSIASSPSIVDGRLFWGTGYAKVASPGNTVYSFGLASDTRTGPTP